MASAPSNPAAMPRHALGLPAGSVRALLAFGVLGLSWGIVLSLGDAQLPLVFIYLQGLMILILASFFAAHGHSIGGQVSTGSPLGLPRGSVRFLMLGGYAGLAYYLYHTNRDFQLPALRGDIWFTLLVQISGFFLGHLISRCVKGMSGGSEPYWYQDIQAWLAIVALIAMAIVAIVHLFINPTLKPTAQLDMPTLEVFLSAVVGFYFGSRS